MGFNSGFKGLSPLLYRNVPKYIGTGCVLVRRHDRSLFRVPEDDMSIVHCVGLYCTASKTGRMFSFFGG